MEVRRFFGGEKKESARSQRELARRDGLQDAVVRMMAAVAAADGELDDSEIARMAEIYREATGSEVSPGAIRAGVRVALDGQRPVADTLALAAAALEPGDKADVIYAGIRVALANGAFDDSESSLLSKAALAMNVDAAAFRQIVERARARAG